MFLVFARKHFCREIFRAHTIFFELSPRRGFMSCLGGANGHSKRSPVSHQPAAYLVAEVKGAQLLHP